MAIRRMWRGVVVAALLLVPAPAAAQHGQDGAIVGTVTDRSGAVLVGSTEAHPDGAPVRADIRQVRAHVPDLREEAERADRFFDDDPYVGATLAHTRQSHDEGEDEG